MENPSIEGRVKLVIEHENFKGVSNKHKGGLVPFRLYVDQLSDELSSLDVLTNDACFVTLQFCHVLSDLPLGYSLADQTFEKLRPVFD